MSSCDKGQFVLLKVMIGTLVAGVFVVAGCNTEVGTAPPGDNKAVGDTIRKQEEKDVGAFGKRGAPKSIKGKVLQQAPGGGN
jgi:hypothetical protein